MTKKLFVLLFLFGTGAACVFGSPDFRQEMKLQEFSDKAEKSYAAGKWEQVISYAHAAMKISSPDSPHRRRMTDLITLAMDRQNQHKLLSEKQQERISHQKTAQQNIIDGTNLLKEQKYAEAQALFKIAAENDPKDAETHYLIAFTALKLNKPSEAYVSFKNCLQCNPEHPRALFHLPELSFKLKRFGETEDLSRRSIRSMRKRLEELRTLAGEQKVGGFNDKAIATGRKIYAVKRNLAQTFYLIGLLAERSGEWGKAQRAFQGSLIFDPRPLETYFHLGQAHFRQKHLAAAQNAFEQSLFIGETIMREQSSQAKKLLDEGKTNEAVAMEVQNRGLKKKMAMVRYAMAICAAQRRDPAGAIESADIALKHDSDFLQARYAKAVFLAVIQEYPRALYEVREMLKKAAPNSSEAVKGINLLKKLMDKSVQTTLGKGYQPIARKTSEKPIVEEYVKDNPGLGGRQAEEEWQEILPTFREIEQLRSRDNLPEAIRKLLHLRIHHPQFIQIHSVLGQCYVETGRFEDAIDSFKKALALNPNEAESLGNLAYIYALRGQFLEKAQEMAAKAVKLSPRRAEFHHTLGWVHFRLGDVEKAARHYQQALALRADYPLARYNLGLAQYLAGSFDLALNAFDQVIAANPKHDKALLFRAITLARLKRTEDALKALEEMKKDLPKGETLVQVVDKLHSQMKFAHERDADLPIPAIKHPAPIEKLLEKARDYRDKGLVTRAKELYLQCQRLNPAAFAPHFELGAMYAMSGLNVPALRAWEQAMKLNPNSFDLHLNMGKMYYKINERLKAKESLNKAEGMKPDHPEPSYYLGLIAYEEQKFESAESYALQATRLNQRFFKALALLGMSRIRQARYSQARDVYETIYLRAPQSSSIQRHAQKKLWELVRLMAPNRAPSVPDAMRQKEYLYAKATEPLKNLSFEPPKGPPPKKRKPSIDSLTTADKITVLSRLESFKELPTPPMPGEKGLRQEAEKRHIQRRLELFRLTQKHAPPPPSMSSKYKLRGAPQPPRPADPGDDYVKQGIAFSVRGLLEDARQSFEKAREVSPGNVDALLNLGFLQTTSGNFQNAFDAFVQAVKTRPGEPQAQMALGNLFWLGGKGKEAVDYWKTVSGEVKPDRTLSVITQTEKVWQRLIADSPGDVDAQSNLGLIYLFTNRPDQALASFKTVLQLDPDRIEHQFYQAACHIMKYLQIKDRAEKKAARERLLGLAAMTPPFPHSGALLTFVNSL
jgi:tetratricopeptide (TPR) repeat protein